VLVVDDEAELRDLVAQALAEHGHQVHRAQDSRSALAVARRLDRLDVLVTDLVLPGRNGAELARLVRRGRPGLPVVAMSGFAATEAIEQLPRDVTVLSKPFSIDELLVAVARSVRAPGRGAGQGSKR
jgi:CheY-like chemotaxis protein